MSMTVARIAPLVNRRTVDRAVQTHLADWRALLTKHVQDGRELLRNCPRGAVTVHCAEQRLSIRWGSSDGTVARWCDCPSTQCGVPRGIRQRVQPET